MKLIKNKRLIIYTAITALLLVSALLLPSTTTKANQDIFIKSRLDRAQERIDQARDRVADIKSNLPFVEDEILVKFKNSQKFHRVKLIRGQSVASAVERFKKRFDVEYAEPNYIATISMVPNDTYYNYQWHLPMIGLETAWNTSQGQGVVVAVVDSGVAYENYSSYYLAPDLVQTNFVPGYDFVNNDSHPNDDNGHGTHVAGTIAQSTNNSTGVAGVAYKASIMPVKVMNRYGSGNYADIAEGIKWAADNGAQIINLSLGGTYYSTTIENAVAYAYNQGVTIIAASGNNGRNSIHYPAAHDNYVIAVGAVRYDKARASYSNYGSSLDLTAPGGDLRADQNGDGYGDGVLQQTFSGRANNFGYYFYEGTSMASPHVAGVAALVLASNSNYTPDQVRSVLTSTAEDLGEAGLDNYYGHGLVNAANALSGSSPPPPPPPPPPEPENEAPVADVGGPYSAYVDDSIQFNGSGSSDPDGDTITYSWNFGDGNNGTGIYPTHTYTTAGTYTVSLIVNDGDLDSNISQTTAQILEPEPPPPPPPPPSGETEVFYDSFESGLGNWTQDSQRDWRRRFYRATEGRYSAEVDGRATNATITTTINLGGRSNARITFNWLAESSLDNNEYLAFDINVNNTGWQEVGILMGNVDDDNNWHEFIKELSGLTSLQIRFRGKMSSSREDAYVDEVKVIAW